MFILTSIVIEERKTIETCDRIFYFFAISLKLISFFYNVLKAQIRYILSFALSLQLISSCKYKSWAWFSMTKKQTFQRALQALESQVVKFRQTQKDRQSTLDRSRLAKSESRDELARTFFKHNKRRKRNHEYLKEKENDNENNESSTSTHLSSVKLICVTSLSRFFSRLNNFFRSRSSILSPCRRLLLHARSLTQLLSHYLTLLISRVRSLSQQLQNFLLSSQTFRVLAFSLHKALWRLSQKMYVKSKVSRRNMREVEVIRQRH